jgi:hypothetical protein
MHPSAPHVHQSSCLEPALLAPRRLDLACAPRDCQRPRRLLFSRASCGCALTLLRRPSAPVRSGTHMSELLAPKPLRRSLPHQRLEVLARADWTSFLPDPLHLHPSLRCLARLHHFTDGLSSPGHCMQSSDFGDKLVEIPVARYGSFSEKSDYYTGHKFRA